MYGKPIVPPILRTKEKIFVSDEFVQDYQDTYSKVQQCIASAQQKQQKSANMRRRAIKYEEGELVLLKFEKKRLRKKKGSMKLYPKLTQKYYGSFKVKKVINEVTCELDLPITWKIHNKFHVSLLKKFNGPELEGFTDSELPEV
ncbi:hypothetical protein O6H91_04G012900 [Diphasiastrum complanatum]|uniref:Uncharacterized protein n=1 Tax=Diphasiastrum complanatum TaxID=34168 RepID=A0ACC2DU86_DIPCM|nr:hypothetical protein O6H91_04G012900 [Diphasiastrum complanatum]